MIERTISRQIESLKIDFKIIFTTGSRQVGKTTLLKEMKEAERDYISFDETSERNFAKSDPDAFFLVHRPPCLIDEVQRVEELFIPMKKIVDENDSTNQIWITGSQKPKLKKHVGDTLAGRVVEIEVYPLSQAEKQGDAFRPSFFPLFKYIEEAPWPYEETLKNIIIGGYPKLQSIKEQSIGAWFRSYINTYLLGDVREEIPDMDRLTFTKILKVIAARTATSLNYSAISDETGLSSRKTIEIISLLESCGLIHIIPPYSNTTIKTLVKTPRIHFVDSGLCCYLLGIKSLDGFLRHPLRGAIFESYVISELIKNARNNGDESSFYFYREENKGGPNGPAEIDLIKESDGILYPIEIKMTTSPDSAMVRHFDRLDPNIKGMGTIICMHDKKTLLKRDVLVMPVSMI